MKTRKQRQKLVLAAKEKGAPFIVGDLEIPRSRRIKKPEHARRVANLIESRVRSHRIEKNRKRISLPIPAL